MTEDVWNWWSRAMENPKAALRYTTTPEWGYYKTKTKDGRWEPVQLWQTGDGHWQGMRDGKPVKNPEDLWTFCCRYPITEEAYAQALRDGTWADDDPTVASMIGHNVGSDLDALRDQIDAAARGADAYAKVDSDEQAAKAQSLRARINELAGEADKRREALKRPHLEAGKAIDAEWQPLIKAAKAIADTVRGAIAAWETVKLRERRAEEERRRAEAALDGAESEAPPPPPPLVADKIKGSYGRAASVGTELILTEIVDQDALYQFLREHPDLRACLRDLGQRALKAGHNPPGVKFEERARIS